MAAQIQIKRSSISGIRPTTSNLLPGEVGINTVDGIMFSANTTAIFEVGSNVSSLRLGGTLTANGSNGDAGQVLTSSGATANAYWSTFAGFSNGTAYTWSAIQTHTANINIGNTTVNTQISNSVFIAMDGNTATHNTSSISVGNATINATFGPATILINGSGIANATGANNAFSLGGALAAAYVNTSAAFTIAGIHTHSANLHTGNTTVNSMFSNAAILLANATTTTSIGITDIRVGNTTSNVVISNTVSSFSGNVSITGNVTITSNVTTIGTAAYFVANGNVGIANTTPAYKLHVQGAIFASGDITAFSDISIKENIYTIDRALEKVNAMRGVYYTRKDTKENKLGLIAQEVEKIIPEVITSDHGSLGIMYQNLVALLIEAVKDLSNEVKDIKNEMKDIKKRIS